MEAYIEETKCQINEKIKDKMSKISGWMVFNVQKQFSKKAHNFNLIDVPNFINFDNINEIYLEALRINEYWKFADDEFAFLKRDCQEVILKSMKESLKLISTRNFAKQNEKLKKIDDENIKTKWKEGITNDQRKRIV